MPSDFINDQELQWIALLLEEAKRQRLDDEAKDIIGAVFLNPRETEIIYLLYGFGDGHIHVYEDVRRIFLLPQTVIEIFENNALRKLSTSYSKWRLESLVGMES